jgi:hypothetical protein
MVMVVAIIPVVSTCNEGRKKDSKGCQKNESFQGSFPSPGDIVRNQKYSRNCGPGYSGIEQAAHQMALEGGNVNVALILY